MRTKNTKQTQRRNKESMQDKIKAPPNTKTAKDRVKHKKKITGPEV